MYLIRFALLSAGLSLGWATASASVAVQPEQRVLTTVAVAAAPKPNADASPAKGRYSLRLRLPEGGVFAEEDTDVEFFIGDTSRTDPVTGPAPVVRAQVDAFISMPAMPGMPQAKPRIHEEGQPGYYGAVATFPHGGEFLLTVTIRPRNGEPGVASIPVQVQDAVPGRKREKPYLLTLKTDPARVQGGLPVRLTLQLRSRKDKKVVTEYEVVHEMEMHLLVVSKDLRTFDHLHPQLGENGLFTLTHTFPYGGDWLLYVDATPAGAGSQVVSSPLKVQGAAPPQPYVLKAPATASGTFSGLQVSARTNPAPLQPRRDTEIQFTVRDEQGNPITEFQPWLGATGHLVLISQDGQTFVHSHPLDDPKTDIDESRGAAPNGNITFLARFPSPGLYKGWLQVQREGKVVTADFVFNVRSGQASQGGR